MSESDSTRALALEVARLRAENERLRAELLAARSDHGETERHHNEVTNKYVVLHGLFSSLDRQSVREVLRDVVVNLIGSEEVACYEVEQDGLCLVWSIGVEAPERLSLTSGEVAEALRSGAPIVMEAAALPARPKDRPSAIVPLCHATRPVGALIVYGLLPQRPEYTRLDRELLDLLSTHGATALHRASGPPAGAA